MSREVTFDGRRIVIEFGYDAAIVDLVRDIPGRKWDRKSKVWTCPAMSLPEVVEKLQPLGFSVPAELIAKVGLVMQRRAEVEKRAERKRMADESRKLKDAEAARRLEVFRGEVAFFPASDAPMTRRIKSAGVYAAIIEETDFGGAVIGYRVPDDEVVRALAARGEPTDAESRLLSVLHYMFTVNAQAKVGRSWHSTAVTRYGKKNHLLAEACRLAAKQSRFTWGWKLDPCPPPNGAAWVLYFQEGGEQLSFHTFDRGDGPSFRGEWNGIRNVNFPWKPAR